MQLYSHTTEVTFLWYNSEIPSFKRWKEEVTHPGCIPVSLHFLQWINKYDGDDLLVFEQIQKQSCNLDTAHLSYPPLGVIVPRCSIEAIFQVIRWYRISIVRPFSWDFRQFFRISYIDLKPFWRAISTPRSVAFAIVSVLCQIRCGHTLPRWSFKAAIWNDWGIVDTKI